MNILIYIYRICRMQFLNLERSGFAPNLKTHCISKIRSFLYQMSMLIQTNRYYAYISKQYIQYAQTMYEKCSRLYYYCRLQGHA